MTHEQFEELWDMALSHPMRELFEQNSGGHLVEHSWSIRVGRLVIGIRASPYYPGKHGPEYVMVSPEYAQAGGYGRACCNGKMSNEQSLRLVAKWKEANKTPDDLYAIVKTGLSSQS